MDLLCCITILRTEVTGTLDSISGNTISSVYPSVTRITSVAGNALELQ